MALKEYAEALDALHSIWKPHEGQIPIGKAIFNEGKKRVFIQCGRKFGKSEISIYCLVRWAITNPDQECYYIAPYRKQARRIAWKRLKKFVRQLPEKFVTRIGNDNMLEIQFANGSTIYVDGSDNSEADRGLTVNFLVYDEFKDFDPDYHVGMEPNLGITDAPLLVIGTPPDHECQYTELARDCQEDRDGTDFWISLPSRTNPHINQKFLDRKEQELKDRGEWDVWEREYMGKYVKGGSGALFPMLSKEKHVEDHDLMYSQSIRRDVNKLEWFCVVDPGTTTVFAGLIVAINKYTKEVFILDELYENQTMNTRVSVVWPKLQEKMLQLNAGVDPKGDYWYRGYDEAAAWFMNEAYDQFGVAFSPTRKRDSNKEEGISLIKDMLAKGKIHMSDRCKKLFFEMENYVKDKNGKIPKKDDHLIDCLRYTLWAAGYSIRDLQEPKEQEHHFRAYSLDHDLLSYEEDF